MTDLKEIEQAIVAYGLHSSYVRKMVKRGLSVAKPYLTIGLS